jgi:hypothetical protein
MDYTPPRYISCDTKKIKVQRYQMFFGHFKVESRVTSVAWADAYPSNFFLIYWSKLFFEIGNVGKLMLKVACPGPLKGPPLGAKKCQKSVMQ